MSKVDTGLIQPNADVGCIWTRLTPKSVAVRPNPRYGVGRQPANMELVMADTVHVKINQKDGTFTVTGKLNPDPQPSRSSGKQLILHTTGGTQVADGDKYKYLIDGKEVTANVKVNLNIGVDNPGFSKTAK